MARSTKTERLLAKAYASGIMLDHSRWSVDPITGEGTVVKKHRFCTGCGEVLTTGYDPTELDIIGHQYDELLKAGMGWIISPTQIAEDVKKDRKHEDFD
jgi:hypothetical protein